jgi:hypothetical protein
MIIQRVQENSRCLDAILMIPTRALALARCAFRPNPLPIRALPQDSPDPSSLSSLTSGRRDRASPCASKQSPNTQACTRVGKLARHPRQQCDRVKAGEISLNWALQLKIKFSSQPEIRIRSGAEGKKKARFCLLRLGYVATHNITGFAQSLAECHHEMCVLGRIGAQERFSPPIEMNGRR